MSGHRSRRARDGWLRALSWAAVVTIVGFIIFCGIWRAQGGRWERVETPSMGTVAPVGTLLWVKPVALGTLKVGDFITFHPPGQSQVTYSHRVYKLNADGTISTKGVIPAPDPWRLASEDIVGKVAMHWWGAGWIVAAAPILIIGFIIVMVIRALVGRDWKLPVTILLGSLVVTAAIVYYKPFINAQQLGSTATKTGGAEVTYVGTGLLPIRLVAPDGASVVMRDGAVGTVHVATSSADHKLAVTLEPAIPWWVWLVLIGSCFLPAFYSLLVGFPTREEDGSHPGDHEPG